MANSDSGFVLLRRVFSCGGRFGGRFGRGRGRRQAGQRVGDREQRHQPIEHFARRVLVRILRRFGQVGGDHHHRKARLVLREDLAVAVVNHAARRGHIHLAEAIAVGQDAIFVALHHLKLPQAADEQRHHGNHREAQQDQPDAGGINLALHRRYQSSSSSRIASLGNQPSVPDLHQPPHDGVDHQRQQARSTPFQGRSPGRPSRPSLSSAR